MKYKLILGLLLLVSPGLLAEELATCAKDADTSALDAILFQDEKLTTDSIIILKDGCILYERYNGGWKKSQRHHGWSMGKGVTSILTGIAVKMGYLGVEDFVTPENDDPRKSRIRVRHLLEWSSGISFSEGYEDDFTDSDVMRMLYTVGSGDMGAYTLSLPMAYEPGLHHYYSSGDSNLIMWYLKKAIGSRYDSFPWEVLFDRIGMTSVVFEQDRSGTFVGSSYMYATPRDWARFGQFLLQNGNWKGEQLIPEWWMKRATSTSPSFYTTEITEDMKEYNPGWQFFVNTGDAKRNLPPPWPDATTGTYMTSGHWGQVVAVIPEHRIVIVRLANDRKKHMDLNLFFGTVINTFGVKQ